MGIVGGVRQGQGLNKEFEMNNKFSVIAAMVAFFLVAAGFGVSFVVVDPVLVSVTGAVALVGTVLILVVIAERVW